MLDFIQNYIDNKEMIVSFMICTSCNLNCMYCSGMSSICEKEFAKLDDIEYSIKSLSNHNVKGVFLTGGEPLLHPNLKEIIEIIRKYYKGHLRICTNGILIKKLLPICDFLRENEVIIEITKYPNINYSKISQFTNENNLELYINQSDNTNFRTTMIINKMKENSNDNFKDCIFNCGIIWERFLYPCRNGISLKYLNKKFGTNFEVQEKDRIPVDSSFEDILEFLSKKVPMCKYCNFLEHSKYKISKKQKEEFIL